VADGDYLFDLVADPGETVNLLAEEHSRHRGRARQLLREAGTGDRQPMTGGDPLKQGDEETKRRLRALGYN
jgi:hypothetical protein